MLFTRQNLRASATLPLSCTVVVQSAVPKPRKTIQLHQEIKWNFVNFFRVFVLFYCLYAVMLRISPGYFRNMYAVSIESSYSHCLNIRPVILLLLLLLLLLLCTPRRMPRYSPMEHTSSMHRQTYKRARAKHS